ncbi:arylsulfatase A-like enzyme [Wenyingzhuangia heitensis]|uniref:Arylsulfatase A-like enzyme n=1 Tax=Wenyingzhuangia heitensis TaxID=1487859 RepID=A0ABX0U7M9_9FLAO|nr:arylsulfatase [Wenyingzhuangia heitensis]NIJ44854.1 arylsulfatase A-like enzyme [Wenyingzhuangia heitensis]
MNKLKLVAICIVLLTACKAKTNSDKKVATKPNIIYIMADDLGIGDLGTYGQQKISTPNIDALATNGIKFTQHYSGSAVCAPSRSSLMTGQHTGHTPIRGNKEDTINGGQVPLPANSITIAELLKGAGYTTGMFGKWGLGFGEGDPNKQGFDEFYGYNDQKLAHRYYPAYLNHNQEIDSLEGNDWTNTVIYAQDKIQEKTLEFISENKEKPFFAYVPLVLPHAELISPKDSILQKYIGKFDEVPYKDHPYSSDYGPNMIEYKYCTQEIPYAVFASMVDRMDTYVGQIVAKVKELGLEDNTLIMFTSDNGAHDAGGANPKYFNSTAGLRGIKRDLYEGGIRAPFVATWPGKIKPGTLTNHVSAFWDVMPTLAEIVGVETPKQSDGISFLPTLLNQKEQKQHDYLYWEFNIKGGRKAVRLGKWKGVIYKTSNKKSEIELYDLEADVEETNNVAKDHPEVVAKIEKIMLEARTESNLFKL